MFFTALTYSWYQDKNRQTPPELFDNHRSVSDDDNKWTATKFWTFLIVFICEVILLMYAVPLALRVARTQQELMVHLVLALLFTPVYVAGAVIIQMYGYYTGAR